MSGDGPNLNCGDTHLAGAPRVEGHAVESTFCRWFVVVFALWSAFRVSGLERIWSDHTRMYDESVQVILEVAGEGLGPVTLVLEDPPLAFPYVSDAVSLHRPGWTTIETDGGRKAAEAFKPCVYIKFEYEGDRVSRLITHRIE